MAEDDDEQIIQDALSQPIGSKFRKHWIEFDCQKGVHHRKYATYENKKRVRVAGGFLGRFNKVRASGRYGERRVYEFVARHNCHYAERFQKDLDECGIGELQLRAGLVAGALAESRKWGMRLS